MEDTSHVVTRREGRLCTRPAACLFTLCSCSSEPLLVFPFFLLSSHATTILLWRLGHVSAHEFSLSLSLSPRAPALITYSLLLLHASASTAAQEVAVLAWGGHNSVSWLSHQSGLSVTSLVFSQKFTKYLPTPHQLASKTFRNWLDQNIATEQQAENSCVHVTSSLSGWYACATWLIVSLSYDERAVFSMLVSKLELPLSTSSL